MNKKPFIQHGLNVLKDPGDGADLQAVCPFCGKKKFFLNEKKGLWDCKVCGKEGGVSGFLSLINDRNKEDALGDGLEFLGEIRSLKPETFEFWNVGLNKDTGEFSIPYYSRKDPTKVSNIKRYDPAKKTFFGTSGSSLEIFGSWNLSPQIQKIWVCEGEWDSMAMWEALKLSNRLDKEGVISLPGASQWKPVWLEMFRNKDIVICFDNDAPGIKGGKKLGSKIEKQVRSLKYLHWDQKFPDKYDLRDLYNEGDEDIDPKENAEEFFEYIKENLHSKPFLGHGDSEQDEVPEEEKEGFNPVYDGEFIPPSEVYKVYRKWLHLPRTEVLDVLYGSILANRMEGDPVWMFLVAPSGGTKSELLMSLNEAQEIFATTTLTSSSLISGMNMGENDPSLIPKLDGKVLIVKDFTTILNMPSMARDEIFGILRDAYDGKIEKMFGNGVTREYTSTFGVLAGTTPAIELFAEEYVALGERFLRWREPLPTNSTDLVMRALMNSNKETSMRDDLSGIGKKVLSFDYSTDIEIPMDIAHKIVALAQWVATLRGAVNRDRFTKEITNKPFKEVGTRLAKQFAKLGMGIAMFRGDDHITEEIMELLCRMAFYTVNSKLTSSLKLVHKLGNLGTKELSETLKLPTGTVKRILEDLVALEAVKKNGKSLGLGGALGSISYSLNDECSKLMEESGISSLIERKVI